MVSQRQGRERGEEAGSTTSHLEIPEVLKTPKEALPVSEKTSLYVPSEFLFNGQVDFRPSSFSDEVLVTRDIAGLLKAIFKHGDVAKRYGENGLENDPNRQQIAIYTLVVCQGRLLWYQRASANNQADAHGDTRLQGRYSIGFGGHKTKEDIFFSREDLFLLEPTLPAILDEVGTMLGLNRGLFAEVQEELSLTRDQIKKPILLGGLHDRRIENPDLEVQVGQVHTGLVAVLEIEPLTASGVDYRDSEIGKAWWMPFDLVEEEFSVLDREWQQGKGPKVESWTEIVIKEFWRDYLSRIDK